MIGGERYVSRETFSKVTVSFESEGVDCSGWLYRPDRPRDPPLIVMGPGFAAERTFGYPAYAEHFAREGYAVFLFDYRRFGDSEGDPRGLISVADQMADWEAAIARAARLEGVDGDRLALWGASLAGGHALRLATTNRRVDAVIAQTPFVDGRAIVRSRGVRWLVRAFAAGARDRLSAPIGRRHRVPAVLPERSGTAGDDPGFALLPDQSVADAFRELVPLRSDWTNAVPAGVIFGLWNYRPVQVLDDVDVPTLLLAGADDPVVSADTVADAAAALPEATFVSLPTGHLDFFAAPWRDQALGHQLTFLERVV